MGPSPDLHVVDEPGILARLLSSRLPACEEGLSGDEVPAAADLIVREWDLDPSSVEPRSTVQDRAST